MAFSQGDIDALDSAYKSGAQSARMSNGEEVTFRSIEEYRKLRAMMQAEVSGGSTGGFLVMQPNTLRGL